MLEELPPLSRYQERVLRYASQGWSDDEIARRMKTTRGAVQISLSHIYSKMGITDPTRRTNPRVIATALYRSRNPKTGFARR